MAVKRPVVMKKGRKTPANQRLPLRPAAAREVMFSPAETGASAERTAGFDPHLVLKKLATGKTCREYRDKQAVFRKGDTRRMRCSTSRAAR
jgi:hypothetical protein